MSVRCIGNQLLETASSTLLDGASNASVSFWIRVNTANNITTTNGVEIFGDSGGKFSATLSGKSGLKLRWLSNNGSANGSSSYTLTLVPGSNYHLATTWQDGAQGYFVNGVQVFADTQVGSIGVLGDTSGHPYRLGSDVTGTDVTLDEPTLWAGYALSAEDVLKLCNRAVLPKEIANASVALQWSLDGPNGVAVNVGDAGLADVSKTGLNLSTIVGTAPSYQGTILSFYPSVTASVAPSGESIILLFEDGGGNPIKVTSIGSPNDVQTISFVGNPSGGNAGGSSITLAFGGQTTAPIATTLNPPTSYALWTIPATAGHSYRIAGTWPPKGNASPSVMLYTILDSDGLTVLASNSTSPRVSPSGFTYGTIEDGGPAVWQYVDGGGAITPTGNVFYVRMAASTDYNGAAYVDAIYVKDTTAGGSPTVYDDGGPNLSFVPNTGIIRVSNYPLSWLGTIAQFNAAGTANYSTITGGAPAIQSALQALSGVQAGGLTVTSSGSGPSTAYILTFNGPMANADQPLITASDPSVSVAHSVVGGQYVTVSINGGAPVPLSSLIWYPTNPFILGLLPQSPPSPQTLEINSGISYKLGKWTFATSSAALSGGVETSATTNSTCYFPFEALPPGTYQLAATWPASGSLSRDAQFLIQDGSGNTLETVSVNQTIAPSDYASAGAEWKIIGTYTIPAGSANSGLTLAITTAGATGTVLVDSAQLTMLSASQTVKVDPGDVVTVTIPSNHLTCTNGPVAGATLPAANLAGGTYLPAFTGNPAPTMTVGYNVEPESNTLAAFELTNLAKRVSSPLPFAVSSDANGYPIKFSKQSISNIAVTFFSNDLYGLGKGLNTCPNGLYTVEWDGDGTHTPANLSLQSVAALGTSAEVTSYAITGKPAGNRRVFNIQAGPLYFSPTIDMTVTCGQQDPADGNWWGSLQNLKIYPPDPSDPTGMTPWANPPEIHPNFWEMSKGAACFRFLDALATNNDCVAEFDQLKPASALSYHAIGVAPLSVPIASIGPPTGTSYFDPTTWVVIQVTTTEPHGFFSGLPITINNGGTVDISASSGSSGAAATTFSLNSWSSLDSWVLSDTEFLLPLSEYVGGGVRTMTNTLTPTGATASAVVGSSMPLPTMVDLCNGANDGAGVAIHFNVPVNASDDFCNQAAAYIFANLKPGRKVYVEFSNEVWNFGFPAYYRTRSATYAMPGSSETVDLGFYPFYVTRAAQVHQLFAAAAASAGRSADLVRVMGSQAGNPGNTDALCSVAAANGITFDALCIDGYFNNSVSSTAALVPIFNLMTAAQDLDHLELLFAHGNPFGAYSFHRTGLNQYGFGSVEIINYESGPGTMATGGSFSNANARSHAVVRHPRMFNIIQSGFLSGLQAGGVVHSNIFYLFANFFSLNAAGTIDSPLGLPYEWSTWFGWDQRPGTGGVLADPLNVSNFEQVNLVKSEVGGAYQAWSSLVANPIAFMAPSKSIPGRNGLIRATGYPHGAFRPTR